MEGKFTNTKLQDDPFELEKLEKEFSPHNINIPERYHGTGSISDVVANIVTMSKVDFGRWTDFTFEDYERFCSSNASSSKDVSPEELERLVEEGYLELHEDRFSVTVKFFTVIKALAE